MNAQPQQEHHWLDRLVGEWTYEIECGMGSESDRSQSKPKGIEIVRSLGGFWTVAETDGEMPECGTVKTITTLGYDPKTDRYVGTFVGSMMAHLWVYSGSLDATGKVLTLEAEGPNFSDTAIVKYQDIHEFISDDRRTLTSRILGEDGNWNQFMTSHYWRKNDK